MKAWLNLRYSLSDRYDAFSQGFKKLGYSTEHGIPKEAKQGDLFCSWNRIGRADVIAQQFEAAGLPVIIAENSTWGNDFLGGQWLSLWRNLHNRAGRFGKPDRWDCLNVELAPWRTGEEVVILPQRGIGSPPVAMPHGWADRAYKRTGGRVRPHPGKNPCKTLEDDLANARLVVTWGSGSAVKALMIGVPVESDMPNWCGEQNNTDAGRLAMFRRLAWSQWHMDEIRSGEAFEWLLR